MQINKKIFWDIDTRAMDFNKNARFIIERVLTRGTMNDWQQIKQLYGLEKIKQEVVQIRFLDKITLNFCSKFFDIPKNQFKCYNTPPSYRQLWNY